MSERLIQTNFSEYDVLCSEINTVSRKGGDFNAPLVLTKLIEKIADIFLNDDYAHFLPSIDVARGSEKKQRNTRCFAMARILATVVKMTDIKTLRIGTYNAANDWRNATIERIATAAKVSLSNAKKILILLERAGIITSSQSISVNDVKKGLFKISVKRLSTDFIAALGLIGQLDHDRKHVAKERKETAQLEKNLPYHLRSNNTPAARLMQAAYKNVAVAESKQKHKKGKEQPQTVIE